MVTEY